MKKLLVILTLIVTLALSIQSQEVKKDTRSQLEKEASNDLDNIKKISILDLIEALEVSGIGIHKFKLGEFDKKYYFSLILEEYVDNKLILTDTLIAVNNQYHYYEGNKGDKYYLDYIDQIKIFTKDEEDMSRIYLKTYGWTTKKEIKFKKTEAKQFYIWRRYSSTNWVLDKKVPLLVCASSWKDGNGRQRFCGVVDLSIDKKRTEELLSQSPHYFVISYKVSEL